MRAEQFAEIWRPNMIEQGKRIDPRLSDEEALILVANIGLAAANLPPIEKE